MFKIKLFISLLLLSTQVFAENTICNSIRGFWKQTHISNDLDRGLIKDESQGWDFSTPKKLVFHAYIPDDFGMGLMESIAQRSADSKKVPPKVIKKEIPYECNGSIITLHAAIKNQVKIVRLTDDLMVWESIDFGGYIYARR